jgi:DNA-binding NtrC family response regulator
MGLPIHLPPLRERGHDILLLAKHFLDEFCRLNNLPTTSLSPDASQQLLHYPFPGNVRELKAMLELAAVLCSNACIEPADLHWNTTMKAKQLKTLSAQGTLKEQIAQIIQHQLNANQGDVLKTAEQLDIGKSRIYQMLEKGEIKK